MLNSYRFGAFDGDASNYMKAFTTPPSAARAAVINTFFLALKADTTYSAFDELYLLGGADNQCTLLNCITPSQTLTIVGSPTFTADSGWAGNGTDAALNSPTAMASLTRFQQDSAHLGVWSLTDVGNAAYYDCGTTANVNTCRLNCRDATSIAANINGVAGSTVATADSLGHNIINRSASGSVQIYKGGSSVGTDTDASSAVNSGNFTILRNRSSTAFSIRNLMAAHCGRSLLSGEVTTLFNALAAYKTAIGA